MQRCTFAPSTVYTRGTAVRPRVPAQRRGVRMVTQAKVITVEFRLLVFEFLGEQPLSGTID